jgi:MFS family permease
MAQVDIRHSRVAVMTLFFVNGALFATWASRIPAVQFQRGLSNSTLGMALLSLAFGALIAMPLSGWVIQKTGSGKLCKISSLLSFAMLPLAVFVPGLGLFFAALFLFGLCQGTLDVAMNAQAVVVERQFHKPIMSSFHALWSTGSLSGAALGSVLAARSLTPLSHSLIVASVLCVGTLLAFPYLLEAHGSGEITAPSMPPKPVFKLGHPVILALGTLAFCVMMGEGAIGDWSALYLRKVVGTGEGLAAVGYTVFSITMAGARFLGDALSARFGPVTLVRTGGVLATLGILLALAFANVPLTLLGFALVGVGFATVVPTVFSASGNIPGIAPGIGLGSVTTLGYLGFLTGPPIIGLVADLLGLRAALGLVVAASVVVACLASAVRCQVSPGHHT